MPELVVVMPVFNEEEAVAGVIEEWLGVLRGLCDFRILCLNDGSRDNTAQVLGALRHAELEVVHKPNSGHGPTCLEGYRRALAAGAPWVLQIDSDGQCDPAPFPRFWAHKRPGRALYGYRRRRQDGRHRFWISRIVSVVAWLATGIWVADANTPYRLMPRELLEKLDVASDFHLANVAVAVQQSAHIDWIPIPFRRRRGGQPSQSARGLAFRARQLYSQLRKEEKRRRQRGGP